MSLSKRIEALERASNQEIDRFVEALVERTLWLPLEEREAITELVAADLAGEDVETTRPETLAVLDRVIAEVQSEFAKAG